MDAGNMLKPALARGELHVVGATTLDEYRRSIEKDAALARRFQPILVPEPSVDGHHRDPARAARPLRGPPPGPLHRRGAGRRRRAVRPLPHRPVPAGQGDRPDRPGGRPGAAAHPDRRPPTCGTWSASSSSYAGTRTRRSPTSSTSGPPQLRDRIAELERADRRRRTATTADELAGPRGRPPRTSPRWSPGPTGIPVSQLTEEEKERLLGLEEHLHERVVGQDEAVTAVAEAVLPLPRRAGRPGPADRQLPVPRPDRRRQDRAGPRAGRGAVRRARTGWSGWT